MTPSSPARYRPIDSSALAAAQRCDERLDYCLLFGTFRDRRLTGITLAPKFGLELPMNEAVTRFLGWPAIVIVCIVALFGNSICRAQNSVADTEKLLSLLKLSLECPLPWSERNDLYPAQTLESTFTGNDLFFRSTETHRVIEYFDDGEVWQKNSSIFYIEFRYDDISQVKMSKIDPHVPFGVELYCRNDHLCISSTTSGGSNRSYKTYSLPFCNSKAQEDFKFSMSTLINTVKR